MAGAAILCAVACGLCWAVGPLGSRIGVNAASNANKALYAAWTCLTYGLGSFVVPLVNFAVIGTTERGIIMSDSEWRSRLHFLLAMGVLSGLGGLAASYALALANRDVSFIVSMVSNGVYSFMAMVTVLIVFHEHLTMFQWLSGVVLFIGIVIADASKNRQRAKNELPLATTDINGPRNVQNYDAVTDTNAGSADQVAFEPEREQLLQPGYTVTVAPLIWAVIAGCLWACGVVGKRCATTVSVSSPLAEHLKALAACTFFLYNMACMVPIIGWLTCTYVSGAYEVGVDPAWFFRTAPVVFALGLIDGLGGVLGTYALALEAKAGSSSLIAMITNGFYTVVAAILIVVVYAEDLRRGHVFSAALVTLAVVLAYASDK